MHKLPSFVDLARTPKEVKEDAVEAKTMPAQPAYPWGLCIRLNQETLDKLNLDDNPNIGESVMFCCVARVTSVRKNETIDPDAPEIKKQETDIELQITHIATEDFGEDEEEVEEVEEKYSPGLRRRP